MLLNPRQTFEIIGIIQEIMRIIVLVQLNMLTWLHKTSLPGRPEALLMLLETCHSSLPAEWSHRKRIGVCRLLETGMQNTDII